MVKCEPTTTCRARTDQPRAGTHQTSNRRQKSEGRSWVGNCRLLPSYFPANSSICPGDRPGLISSVGWLGRPLGRCSPFAGDSCSEADSSCCSCCRLSSSRRIRSRPHSINSAADACKGLPTESLYWRSAISIWWLRMIWRKLLDSSFNLARRLRCASRSWTLRFLRFLGGSCAMRYLIQYLPGRSKSSAFR
jgi:hypothetical protein